MEHRLEILGDGWCDELGTLYAYDTHPSTKLMVPTEGFLEITLTPNKRFRYRLQYVNITLWSGILTIENPARSRQECTQLFGFFGKNDVLKFRIRLKNEKEIASTEPYYSSELCIRKEGRSAGFLRIVHGGVFNEEDTWKMLSNYYEGRFIEQRADWTLHPGIDTLAVYVENEKDEKVKKLEAICKEKCDVIKKEMDKLLDNVSKMKEEENEKKMNENEKEESESKKVFERKDWRAENHGLKVVKLTKSVDEKPKNIENKSGKSAKSEKSIPQKSEKSGKSITSQKSVSKKVTVKALESQNPAAKSNRSERAQTPGKSQKSASSVKSSSKETATKTEISQNTELKSSAEPEKVQNQEKKKKKNPCCSIL